MKRQVIRHYKNGGQIRMQDGYTKKNGTYVKPHIKTYPDNSKSNNRKSILGY